MRPRLNRKLSLEAPVRAPDGAGGSQRSWSALGTLWAEIRSGSGREVIQGLTGVSRSACRIIVRAAPVGSPQRPHPEQRFREGARVFSILSVAEADVDGRYLVCHAKEEIVA